MGSSRHRTAHTMTLNETDEPEQYNGELRAAARDLTHRAHNR